MIKPIALYGVEIWGLLTPAMLKKKLELYDLFKNWEYEKLNLKFCKYLLGVNKRSTNIAVLSELGRMPLFISHITAMFTFLHRLENSDCNSLVYHALKESIALHTSKVNCWFSTISCLREKLGLDLDVCKKMKLYKFKVELKKSTKKKLYDILAQNKGHFHKYWQIMHIFYL